jgi:UDP-2,3-diacylglucosamine pyrophosphatase LpxH
MQVFISDVHLTDGTSGETIKAGAFKLFRDHLRRLVLSIKKEDGKLAVQELKIVLLGDIFDVIRSTKWLGVKVRPWSPIGPKQKAVVQNIVNGILQQNKDSFDYLNDLRHFAERRNITFELQYIIGNHDWLINRYPTIVKTVASALDITPPP